MPRRTITIIALATIAAAMMGAEDPKCDNAKGRQPSNARHDPKPLKTGKQSPAQEYRFRFQFSTGPTRHVHYSWSVGGEHHNNIPYGQTTFIVREYAKPGDLLTLTVDTDNNIDTGLLCAIAFDDPKLGLRQRAWFLNPNAHFCDIDYTVQPNEPRIIAPR